MSRLRFMATTDGPGLVHVREAVPNLIVPFVHEPTVIDQSAGSEFFWVGQSIDSWVEMWWRYSGLSAQVSLDYGSGVAASVAVAMTRNTSDELDLCLPGSLVADIPASPVAHYGKFSGTYYDDDWNGLGGLLDISAELEICFHGLPPNATNTCPARLYWRDTDILYPSFKLILDYTISTPGTEYSAYTTSYAVSGGAAVGTVDFVGGSVPLYTASDYYSATQSVVEIEPVAWFGYDGIWSEGTGAQILDPRQDPV